jgi:hypothetical protein
MEALGDPALRVREAARALLESLGAAGTAFLVSAEGRGGDVRIVGSDRPLRPASDGPGECIVQGVTDE